jgi:hypothetical protein
MHEGGYYEDVLKSKTEGSKIKRVLVLVLAAFLSFGSVTAVFSQAPADEYSMFQQKFAAAKVMPFEGQVLNHDPVCHCIVVKTSEGLPGGAKSIVLGDNLVLQDDYARFDQSYDRLKGLKVGAMVKGEYKTVNYINYAISVSYK